MNYAGLESIYECVNIPIKKTEFFKFVQKYCQDHHFIFYNSCTDILQLVKAELIELTKAKLK